MEQKFHGCQIRLSLCPQKRSLLNAKLEIFFPQRPFLSIPYWISDKYFPSASAKQADHLHLTVLHKDQVSTSCLVQPVLDAYPKPCLLWRWVYVCVYICIFAYIRSMLLKWVSQSPPHAVCYHIANHLGLHELDSWRHALAACGCPVLGTKLETVKNL